MAAASSGQVSVDSSLDFAKTNVLEKKMTMRHAPAQMIYQSSR